MSFGRAGHLDDQIFHVPGTKPWHYASELRTLSVTCSLCCSALTDTTYNLFEICYSNFQTFAYLCTISHAQSYRGPQNPQWLSEVVMARAQTCYPQMESRDFDHAANPTCCLAACTGSQFVHVCIYAYRYGLSQQLRKNRRYVRLRKVYVHNRGN